MARKYQEVQGYWVYSIYVPSVNKYYIGVSRRKECWQRWDKSNYVDKSLAPYLNEWDSMVKTVLIDGLTKEESYQYEGKIIEALQMNNLCINKQRSGLISVSDRNAYQRELYKNNAEYRKHKKQYRENNKGKIQKYMKQYYENNKEKIREQQRQNRLKKKQQQKQ